MSRIKFVEEISIGTIITIGLLVASIITSFTWTQADVKALQHEVAQLKEQNATLLSKEMVEQMFIIRDVQIIEVKNEVQENRKILREIEALIRERTHTHSEQ